MTTLSAIAGAAPPELRIALLVLGIIASVYGFMLWAARHAYEERARIRCPVGFRMARVVFRIAPPDGAREDVLRCSLLPRGSAFGCGKRCLRPREAAS